VPPRSFSTPFLASSGRALAVNLAAEVPFAAPPCVYTPDSHGWPGSVWEFHKIIPMLTDPGRFGGDPRDAFTVIAPSLPGYGWSGPTVEPGWDVRRVAEAARAVPGRAQPVAQSLHVVGYRAVDAGGTQRLGEAVPIAGERVGDVTPEHRQKLVLEPPELGTIFRVVDFPPDKGMAGKVDRGKLRRG